MPSVGWNKATWDDAYPWEAAGDEWSAAWGGPHAQWYWTVLPRVAAYLPAASVLEIAPGYGRWTHYLKDLCDRLTVVDLADQCIAACRDRFRGCEHITYHTNDGTSLAMVPDGSVDFAFSYDSLVHAEVKVLRAYIDQLKDKLTADGVAFVHHSNLGEYRRTLALLDRLPRGKTRLQKWGLVEGNPHCRAVSVTAGAVERAVVDAGLRCVSQELINWGQKRLNDCLTVFTRPGSRWDRPNRVVRNPGFMAEAGKAAAMAAAYGPPARRAA